MDFTIGKVNSTCQATGSDSGLTTATFECIVATVLERLRQEIEGQRRIDSESSLSDRTSHEEH